MDEDDLTELVNKAQRASSLLSALVSMQEVFNGYGQHTAMDLLYHLAIWPGMPPRELCADEDAYQRLRAGLSTYALQYSSARFRSRCLLVPNHGPPLAFNYTSDDNYTNQFLNVYRKCTVKMDAELFNYYAMLGLLDPAHIIGNPGSVGSFD